MPKDAKKPKRYSPFSTLPLPDKPMNKVNEKRRAKLRAKQFGDDDEAKKKWIVSMLCGVTGEAGDEYWPIDPCHVGSPDPDERRAGQNTRGNGADSTYLFPMKRPVHTDFDNLPEAKFEAKYGVSKQWVREMARELDNEWLRKLATEGPASSE